MCTILVMNVGRRSRGIRSHLGRLGLGLCVGWLELLGSLKAIVHGSVIVLSSRSLIAISSHSLGAVRVVV
jgi:hypothetical protein